MKPHAAFTPIIFTTETNQAKFCGKKKNEACQDSTKRYFFRPLRNWSCFSFLKQRVKVHQVGSIFRLVLNFSFEILFVHRNLWTPFWALTSICKNIIYRHSATWMRETFLSFCSHCNWQTKETGIETMNWMTRSCLHNK